MISVAQSSVLSVTAEALALEGQVLSAVSYAEAAGLVTALREGIAPAALVRPLLDLQELR